MYLPVRLWDHCINISRVHVFTYKAVTSPYQHFSCICIYLQGCGITVSIFLMYMYLPARLWHHRTNILVYMYLPARLWHHRTNISRVHVFTCKAVASPYQHCSCTCIYLQGCDITVSIFLMFMYLSARLWHHRIHIPRVHVFTCKAVA